MSACRSCVVSAFLLERKRRKVGGSEIMINYYKISRINQQRLWLSCPYANGSS
jgi:hypothetical protein